jgi:Zn-dependent metalloprotease
MGRIFLFTAFFSGLISFHSFSIVQPLPSYAVEKVLYSGYSSVPSLVVFSKGKEISLSGVTSFLSTYFEDGTTFSLQLVDSQTDELGYVHYRYQQMMDGIPVTYAYYMVHTQGQRVVSMHGQLFDLINLASKQIEIPDAIQSARDFVSAERYMWEDISEEKLLKRQTGNIDATYFPSAELVYFVSPSDLSRPATLAFRTTIYASKPLSKQAVFVDATLGTVLFAENLLHFKDVKGVAHTVYSGVQTITTDSTGSGYVLRETGRGSGIETYNLKNTTNFSATVDFTDKNNVWDTINVQKDQYAVDAHWGAEKTYDYYFEKHARNSIDNKGFKLINMVHYGTSFGNAYWDGNRMVFGYGDGVNTKNPLVSLDIIGHEITHGLTSSTAKLVLQNESGALNESFSDIFGATIDWYARPDKANWKVGDEISPNFRSLEDPSSTKHPDTYQGDYWIPLNGSDYGGIHSNNGVQNYWYYLLVQGGSGTNDLGKTFSVKGIGIDKAAAIVYRNLTVYMTSLSNFQDARFYSIQAAIDLYGSCSNEVESVTNAWYAVGLGAGYTATITTNFEMEYEKNCYPYKVRFINKSISDQVLSYQWMFGDSIISSEVSPTHVYVQPGKYEVQLISKSKQICAGKDTMGMHSSLVEFVIPKPIVVPVCEKDSLIQLVASISEPFAWYTSDTSSVAIDTLSKLNLQNPFKDTIFYLKTRKPAIETSWRVGIKDLSSNTGYIPGTDRHLIFDVSSPVTLKSVLVKASESGIRLIELRKASGEVIATKSVELTMGENRIQLNFELMPGINYQLGLGGTLGKLLRTNAGVKYPYEIEGVLQIKGSNATGGFGLSYYYFFYDWEVVRYNCQELAQEYHIKQTVCTPSTILANFDMVYEKNCYPFKVRFINKSVSDQVLTYQWMFGDSIVSSEISPVHVYAQPGKYEVRLISKSKEISAGKDTIGIHSAFIDFVIPKPTLLQVCEKDSLIQLVASISEPFAWYASDTSTIAIDTLSKLNLQNPLKDTIFYLKTRKPAIDTSWRVGITDLSSNTGYIPGTERTLIFDVSSPVTLKSVLVNASESGMRIIELRNASGEIIATKSVELTMGENRVQLNFELTPGINYQLGLGGTLGKLLITNAGVKYPYEIEGVIQIKGSNATGGFGLSSYYFFYDWEVVRYNCQELAQEYHIKQIVCTTTGMPKTNISGVTVFPNPTTGKVKISNIVAHSVTLVDVLGHVLYSDSAPSEQLDIDMSTWARGVYLLELTDEVGVEVIRIVKE